MSHNLENFKISNYEMRKGNTGEGVSTEIIPAADNTNPYGVRGIPGCKECGGSGWKSKAKYPHPCNECAKRTVPVIEKKIMAVIPDPHSGTIEVVGEANKIERMDEAKITTENRFVPVLYGGVTEEEYERTKDNVHLQKEHVFVKNDLIEGTSNASQQPQIARTQPYTEKVVESHKTPLYTMSNMQSSLPTTTVTESNIIPGSTIPETADTRKKSLGEKIKDKLHIGTHRDEDKVRSPTDLNEERPQEYEHRKVYVTETQPQTHVQHATYQPVLIEKTQPQSEVIYTTRPEETTSEKRTFGEKVKHALHLDKDKHETSHKPEVYHHERGVPEVEYVTREIHHPHTEREQHSGTQTSMPLYSQHDRNTFENQRNYTKPETTQQTVYIPQTYDTAGTNTPQNRTYRDDYKSESHQENKNNNNYHNSTLTEVPIIHERREYIPETRTKLPVSNISEKNEDFERSESLKTNLSGEVIERQEYKEIPVYEKHSSSYYKEVPQAKLVTGTTPYPSGIPKVTSSDIVQTTIKECYDAGQTSSNNQQQDNNETDNQNDNMSSKLSNEIHGSDFGYTHRDTNKMQCSGQVEQETTNRSIPTTMPKERVYNIHDESDRPQTSSCMTGSKSCDDHSINKEKLREYKVSSDCDVCQGQGLIKDNLMCTGCLKKSGICPECHNTGIKLIGHSTCDCSYQTQQQKIL